MKKYIKSIAAPLLGLSCCFLVSCAGSMDPAALQPAGATARNHTGAPIQAIVTGGAARSSVLANISNEDFKDALESSLVKSGMFKNTGGGGYQLYTTIGSIDQPLAGISMRVSMNVEYTLRRGSAEVWRKNIKSTYVAPIGEAFVGAVRVRKATEGAARENIAKLIHELDEKRF